MAEQKEYLDIQEEGGLIRVSFVSLAEIAAQAALGVSGVSALAAAHETRHDLRQEWLPFECS